MGQYRRQTPKIRWHKSKCAAYATFSGDRHYYGPWNGRPPVPEDIQQQHDKKVAEWLANERRPLPKQAPARTADSATASVTVAELVAAFWADAEKRHDKTEMNLFGRALRPLLVLCAHESAEAFGPKRLKAVRELMIAGGYEYLGPDDEPRVAKPWTRRSINGLCRRIVAVFRWGVAEELVGEGVPERLKALRALRAGEREDVLEAEPKRTPPPTDIEAVIAAATPTVAGMIRLQLLTGMRPGELVRMRPKDIDRAPKGVEKGHWVYSPARHKNQHRGHARAVPLTPAAQEVLVPFLERRQGHPTNPVFSPADSEAERSAARAEARATPAGEGNRAGYNARTRAGKERRRPPGKSYTPDTYRRAVEHACKAAKVERFSPYGLRRAAAVHARSLLGLEAVQQLLGHRHASTSEIYAAVSLRDASRTAAALEAMAAKSGKDTNSTESSTTDDASA